MRLLDFLELLDNVKPPAFSLLALFDARRLFNFENIEDLDAKVYNSIVKAFLMTRTMQLKEDFVQQRLS